RSAHGRRILGGPPPRHVCHDDPRSRSRAPGGTRTPSPPRGVPPSWPAELRAAYVGFALQDGETPTRPGDGAIFSRDISAAHWAEILNSRGLARAVGRRNSSEFAGIWARFRRRPTSQLL